jgi:DNA repair exonuclease SbcCD nuclease subunit
VVKLLAFSDAQLGAGSDYGYEPGSRLADQRRALARIAELAGESGADAILFCGDAFQHRRPSIAELDAWRGFLDDAPVLVLAVAGNHDRSGSDCALDVFRGRPNYRPFSVPGATAVAGGHVAVLPWTSPATFTARLGERPSADELAEALVDSAAGLRSVAGPGSVLAVHWALSGCELPTGLPTSALREPVLPLDDLLAQGWEFVVAGHVHKPQRPHGGAVVCGSPYVCDFGEADFDHGCWLVDVGDWADAEFIPIDDRPFLTIDAEVAPNGRLVYPAPLATEADAVVRVRYRCSEERARLVDAARVRRDLEDAGVSRVYAVEARVERSARVRSEEADPDLAVSDALELWIAAETPAVPESLREKTTEYLEEVR